MLFQPTPPARTETALTYPFMDGAIFQPTPPARTETQASLIRMISSGISTHSAREDGDGRYPIIIQFIRYFNPLRPRGRRQWQGYRGRSFNKISTHSAREDGDLLALLWSDTLFYFNPLRPRGRRLLCRSQIPIGFRFQPTPPARTETVHIGLMLYHKS